MKSTEPFYRPRVIFDIDGTLADNSHRQYWLDRAGENKANWPAFYEAAVRDKPVRDVVTLLRMCHAQSYRVTLATGRPEEYRELTEAWLKHHVIFYHDLYMRADGDYRHDYVVKREMLYHDILGVDFHEVLPPHDIVFVVDDRQQVVGMWRAEGLTCLQCAKGDF